MNLIESKVIQTEFEKEIFLDQGSNIKLSNFHYPKKNFPHYEVMASIEIMRIRGNEYYGTKDEFFGIGMTEDLQTVFIFEADKQNIFAIKNEQERQATNELIKYLLSESSAFKKLLTSMIQNLQQANVVCENEIKETKSKLELLERLLKINPDFIKFPGKKNYSLSLINV